LGNSEQLKPGGAIPEKGKKITLSVKNITDLSRDVIKVSFLLQFVYFL
jgi:zinc finger protein